MSNSVLFSIPFDLVTIVSFSSCQRNLIKTFQIEGMNALITKITLIFSSDLSNIQKLLSKKAQSTQPLEDSPTEPPAEPPLG